MIDPGTEERAVDHMPGLDGLRGVLILAIIAYHLGYGDSLFPTVDTFFALSGFLITLLLLRRTPAGRRGLRAWWARRWRRLVPAVAVTTGVVVAVFAARPGVAWDGVATMTWWENWRQVAGSTNYWSPRPSPLRHAWTLSIEEQFYLLWPLVMTLLAALARRRHWPLERVVAAAATAAACGAFGWAAWLAHNGVSPNRIYLGTDTRAGALLLGCAAAAVASLRPPRPEASRALSAAGFLGGAVVVWLCMHLEITDPSTYSGGLALGAVGSALLIVAAAHRGPIERLLGAAPLQWLGVRSYGIYLWAWPAQALIEERWPDLPRPALAAATLSSSVLVGHVSFHVVELPLRGRTAWATRSMPRRVAWTVGLTAVAVSILVVGLAAHPTPIYQQVSAEESAAAALRDVEASLHATTTEAPTTSLPPTPAGVPPSLAASPSTTSVPRRPLRIMTAGDSQAFKAAFPKIPRKDLPPYIESVTVAGVLGCGVLVRAPEWTMYDPARGGDVSGRYCLDTAEVAEVRALRAHPDWMVLFSGGFERPFAYKDSTGRLVPARDPRIRASIVTHLTMRIERARAAGVRTALVEWACMGEEVGDEEKAGWTRWYNAILREVADSIPGTVVIEPNARVCVNSDPTGAPTPEKEAAWGHEVHPVDLRWLWNVQLGPELLAASGG